MTNPYDTHSAQYFKDTVMVNTDEIVNSKTKTQILNNIKSSLEELLTEETLKAKPDGNILVAIQTNLSILEDAYSIDLYKFQFKALTNILRVEIKNIKDLINLTT